MTQRPFPRFDDLVTSQILSHWSTAALRKDCRWQQDAQLIIFAHFLEHGPEHFRLRDTLGRGQPTLHQAFHTRRHPSFPLLFGTLLLFGRRALGKAVQDWPSSGLCCRATLAAPPALRPLPHPAHRRLPCCSFARCHGTGQFRRVGAGGVAWWRRGWGLAGALAHGARHEEEKESLLAGNKKDDFTGLLQLILYQDLFAAGSSKGT